MGLLRKGCLDHLAPVLSGLADIRLITALSALLGLIVELLGLVRLCFLQCSEAERLLAKRPSQRQRYYYLLHIYYILLLEGMYDRGFGHIRPGFWSFLT